MTHLGLVVLAAKAAHQTSGGFHWSPWFTAVGVIILLLYLGYRGQQKKGD